MSKAVLISIRPKWCELISSGKKTVELSKTYPKYNTPFKVYIYCTLGKTGDPHEMLEIHSSTGIHKATGKVIGEFKCDRLIQVLSHPEIFAGHPLYFLQAMEDACVTEEELEQYSNGKDVVGWHISDLVIYDNPKDLSELGIRCREYDKPRPMCGDCEYYHYESNESIGTYEECICEGFKSIKRPPQSWCYVEELKGGSRDERHNTL